MSQICFDTKNIYIICIVVIGLFIFSSYIVRNPLKCPIYQTCPQCKLVQMTQKSRSIIKDENWIRRNINDELVPPQRSYEFTRRSMPPPSGDGIEINVPTRGELPIFQKIGVLLKSDSSGDTDNARLPLFGRPKYPGSNDYDYYVMDGSRNSNKVAIEIKKKQLDNDDQINVAGFNGIYSVSLYQYDQPRYIPF